MIYLTGKKYKMRTFKQKNTKEIDTSVNLELETLEIDCKNI
jgi:hypothetical protein